MKPKINKYILRKKELELNFSKKFVRENFQNSMGKEIVRWRRTADNSLIQENYFVAYWTSLATKNTRTDSN